MRINRRDFLKTGSGLALALAAGGAGALLSSCTPASPALGESRRSAAPSQAPAAPRSRPSPAGEYEALDPRKPTNFTGSLNLPRPDGLLGVLDVPAAPVQIAASKVSLDILAGASTDAWAYQLEHNGKAYLNPILRVAQGKPFAARLTNRIGEPTIVHWHGLHVDWRNDGHPLHAVGNGESYDYRFTVQNRAGTYWYHPHPHTLTGKQSYYGLSGFFVVEDEDDARLRQQLDLEFGATDIPLLIQDKRFDERGQLVYLTGGPMEQFSGFFGDVVAVNLSVNPSLDVSTRLYRFRLLNGSNARNYRLAFARGNDRLPFHLIGTDGGLLAEPRQIDEVFLSPAERVDVLLDLRKAAPGDVVFLRSLKFDPMHNEMGMGGMGGMGGMSHGGMGGMGSQGTGEASQSRLDDGEAFYVLKLAVRDRVSYDKPIPGSLAELKAIDTTGASVRPIELSPGMMQWLINGQSFSMQGSLFRVATKATEIWDIKNVDASMPHPMHLHGFQFQVLERRNSPQQIQALAVDAKKRLPTDLGWKDTVLVWPGETVSIATSFAHAFEGEQTYLFHCHNLEHEDMGMMMNFQVGA